MAMDTAPERYQGAAAPEGRSLTDMHMLLFRAYHAQTNYLRPRMAKAGLGPGQPKLLSYLAVHGPSAQCAIAKAFEVDGATVSRMLESLQKGGFVTVSRGADGRTREAALTEKGHGALSVWEHACDEEEEAMLEGIGEEERAVLASCLERMHENLVQARRKEEEDGR